MDQEIVSDAVMVRLRMTKLKINTRNIYIYLFILYVHTQQENTGPDMCHVLCPAFFCIDR